ncbi:DUF7344 domain-containing protein [Halobacterium rubrum]|uniref:DUF7344 domain-containing protein n=1 Tax=Halobacterium TaxID=2239 RepID=UPI001F3A0979|nr:MULTISPECIES: hypothetical protein [Halobacterium]MDH5021055.1 hypothetical protein [Halobacterium rubrum]
MCDLQHTFRALQHPRRRHAFDCVRTHQSLALADLAELVLERETGTPASEHDPETVRDVYFSLYHRHVPVLREASLVEYEQDADVVGVRDEATQSLSAARDTVDSLLSA